MASRVDTDLEAAIVADADLSVRKCAAKHKVSPGTVMAIRRRHTQATARVVDDLTQLGVPFATAAEEALSTYAQRMRAASERCATEDPRVLLALAPAIKILADALAQLRMADGLRRDKDGTSPPGSSGAGAEASGDEPKLRAVC